MFASIDKCSSYLAICTKCKVKNFENLVKDIPKQWPYGGTPVSKKILIRQYKKKEEEKKKMLEQKRKEEEEQMEIIQVNKLKEIINVLKNTFCDRNEDEIYDMLYKTNGNVKNAYLALCDKDKYDYLLYENTDDYVILNLRDRIYYTNLIEQRG